MRCPACGAAERQDRIGRLWTAPQVVYHCLACDQCFLVRDQAGIPSFTSSEAAVLQLTVNGLTNKEIARKADMSLRTVAIRRRAILAKLGAKNRTELVRKAVELGLVE